MNTRRIDAILCNWPLLGLVVIPIVGLTNNFQNHPVLEIVFSVLFGGGWLVALAYGLYRVSRQRWQPGRVILWVLGLLWFSLFSLPWLYWQHLRFESPRS